ncbi:uncharacterized protein LOC141608714 [Silene latifolia]|uniref:uncharacterized protein LOC141608714 n=1 Tax=Silene latifolia TaxID=37657 RepID=UPI003D76BE0C
MPGDEGKGSKSKTIPTTSPLYLHQSDNTNLFLTQIIFNGDNYDLWAPAVRNGLDAKNKLGFIEGKVKKPIVDDEENNVEAVAWRQCNAMLKAWLRNVIDIKLHPSIAFEQTVSEVWAELKSRYSAGNAPRVHQLKGDLTELSVLEYYTKLKTIWDEIANYSKVPNCTCGAAVEIAKEREEEKVHQFFMGLDNKLYGHVLTNLLMEDPITTLPRAYALILREERHSSMTKEKDESNEAAMAAKFYGTAKGKGSYPKKDEEEETEPPYCTHCKKYYHTEENCYDKHGYETVKARERGRGRRGGYGRGRGRGRSQGRGQQDTYQANAASNLSNSKEGETSKKNLSFTNDEIERIWMLLNASPEGSERLTGLPDGRKIKAHEHGKIILNDDFVLKDDPVSRKEIGRGEHHDGVYKFKSSKEEVAGKVNMSKDGELWHKRLGHPSRSKSLSFSALVNYNLNWNSSQICDSCCRAKQTRNSFSLNNKRCDELFGLIHVDIWGKYPIASLSRAHYFLTIVDDHSRGVWIYLMQDKSEASKYMKFFCQMVKTQFNKIVKIIQSDNGSEFLSGEMKNYYEENGILFQSSNVDTPQQNGRVERKHCHILEKARALQFTSHLPIEFWGECVLTAAYLINRTPTPILKNKTPFEILYHNKPNLTNLKVLGCLCYDHSKDKPRDKFGERGKRCLFLGYSQGNKGWKVYDLNTRRVFVSRDVIYFEHVFPYYNPNNSNDQPNNPHDRMEYVEDDLEDVEMRNSMVRRKSKQKIQMKGT